MKKVISLILSIALCFTFSITGAFAVHADTYEDNSVARIMPIPFTFTDHISVGTDPSHFPPGTAEFDVTIKGTYDAQGDNVISVDSTSYNYTGGINCAEHDVHVVTWTSAAGPGMVFWKLEGNIKFSWTSPTTGIQYETVYVSSPAYSFRASNYC